MSKEVTLKPNSRIKVLLDTHRIPYPDGLAYLICLHYGIRPSYLPEGLERKVLATGIITIDYTNGTTKWNESLFEETEIGYEWVTDWMDLFKRVGGPDRRGTKADVLRRMKKFFVNNPAVRKDDVFAATNKYLLTVSNPIYCKKSHKFIYEMDGSSMLLDYVEQTKEASSSIYNDDVI